MAERFERELAWCVGQLECMLRSTSTKDKDPRKCCLHGTKAYFSSSIPYQFDLLRKFYQIRKHLSFVNDRWCNNYSVIIVKKCTTKMSHDRNVRTLSPLSLSHVFYFLYLGHNQIRANANSEIPLASRFVRRTHAASESTTKDNTFSFNFDIPSADLDKK